MASWDPSFNGIVHSKGNFAAWIALYPLEGLNGTHIGLLRTFKFFWILFWFIGNLVYCLPIDSSCANAGSVAAASTVNKAEFYFPTFRAGVGVREGLEIVFVEHASFKGGDAMPPVRLLCAAAVRRCFHRK
jgi:hypothetical protein